VAGRELMSIYAFVGPDKRKQALLDFSVLEQDRVAISTSGLHKI
jgi:hypothetical protein